MAQIYRGSSPIFDVPEFPPLRRVKPLPKRRRTSDPTQQDAAQVQLTAVAMPQSVLGPNPTAEELVAHADSLSAQMAMQSYYMPIFGGAQDLFRNDGDTRHATTVDFGSGFSLGMDGRGLDEDEHGEGDYIDHLQQPGNTKKRKVPANMLGSPGAHDGGSQEGGDDEPTERAIPTGTRLDGDLTESISSAPPPGPFGRRQGRTSVATLAGLQHKEMLKNRKRQLAAVLGALSHGDTLALDQALSAKYPFAKGGYAIDPTNPDYMKVRLSRRPSRRASRVSQDTLKALPSGYERQGLPESDFSFVWPSATSERLIATKEEVAVLHSRFEAELARQAAKAAEAAKQAALAASNLAKRTDRAQQRNRQALPGGGRNENDVLDPTLATAKGRGGKKKKRSALANASNPHHLRNYVPSRIPHSGQAQIGGNANNANYVSPLPVRFLAAEIPPRRHKKTSTTTPAPVPPLTNSADEWICPFCEYNLFYGEDQAFRRAVRSRRKILVRRRRARERAAAAASGNIGLHHGDKGVGLGEDANPGFDPAYVEADQYAKQAKLRGGANRDRDKGE